jgi:hypothetical protein
MSGNTARLFAVKHKTELDLGLEQTCFTSREKRLVSIFSQRRPSTTAAQHNEDDARQPAHHSAN